MVRGLWGERIGVKIVDLGRGGVQIDVVGVGQMCQMVMAIVVVI